MIIEIIFAVLMICSMITIGYALKQINNIASNAYSFIKSDGIEQKVQADSLERTLKKIEKIAPPEIKQPPSNPMEKDFITELIKNGSRKDAAGHEWEIA